jgi:hypothetical protein
MPCVGVAVGVGVGVGVGDADGDSDEDGEAVGDADPRDVPGAAAGARGVPDPGLTVPVGAVTEGVG